MQLSRERITKAALEILAGYGLADVSMRRVASSLSVAPAALYWHIANKQELISAMGLAIVQTLIDDPLPHPADLSRQLRDAVLGVRDGAEVLVAAMSQPDAEVRTVLAETFVEAVGAYAGSSSSDVRAAALGILHLTLGDAAVHQAGAQLAEATHSDQPTDDDAAALHEQAVGYLLDGLARHS